MKNEKDREWCLLFGLESKLKREAGENPARSRHCK